MVIMLRRDQAALLSIQLLVMCHVHAGKISVDHRNTLVSRGDSVMFICNISTKNASQINWTKGRFYFAYLFRQNLNFSNFTSHRVRIDPDLPTTLNIFNVQHEDAGLYTCNVTATDGMKTIKFNLTVPENPKGLSPLCYFLYILTPVTGFLLCGFILAVSICRKYWTRSQKKDSYDSRTLSYVQFVHMRGEVVPLQPQSCAVYSMNHKQSQSVL